MPRLIAMFLALALVVPMLMAQKDQSPSDGIIYDEVRRRLAADADVRGAALDVTVKDGAVTIEGRVHTEKGRKKATDLAKKVKGVKSVENKLKLYSEK
jgi:hyperosmotically inducible periplasmic protein